VEMDNDTKKKLPRQTEFTPTHIISRGIATARKTNLKINDEASFIFTPFGLKLIHVCCNE